MPNEDSDLTAQMLNKQAGRKCPKVPFLLLLLMFRLIWNFSSNGRAPFVLSTDYMPTANTNTRLLYSDWPGSLLFTNTGLWKYQNCLLVHGQHSLVRTKFMCLKIVFLFFFFFSTGTNAVNNHWKHYEVLYCVLPICFPQEASNIFNQTKHRYFLNC